MKGTTLLIFCSLFASSFGTSGLSASNVGIDLCPDIAQYGNGAHGRGKWTEIIGFIDCISSIIDIFRKPKDSADLAEIKSSLQGISLQLQEIKYLLTEIMNMISETQVQLGYQENERVISDSLLYYNRMMNMTTKVAHHQARQSFIANGDEVFESVLHLLQGLSGDLSLSSDILQYIVKSKQCHRRLVKEYVDQFMGLVNTGIYVLAAFYQNTRISDELSDLNVMYISELYNRTETRVTNQIAACPEEITISVPNGGTWGNWGPVQKCPGNMRAVGFTTKVEDKVWIDNTALNGIRLYCRETGNSQQTTITSSVGPWGNWKSPVQYCSNGQALVGFQLRVEAKRSVQARATAANNINFQCEGGQILEGIGNSAGSWGRWSDSCPAGICGIQTKVQPDQGVFGDDTTLNDVKFFCCQ